MFLLTRACETIAHMRDGHMGVIAELVGAGAHNQVMLGESRVLTAWHGTPARAPPVLTTLLPLSAPHRIPWPDSTCPGSHADARLRHAARGEGHRSDALVSDGLLLSARSSTLALTHSRPAGLLC